MEQKLIELETKWMKAWKNKNEEVVRELLADEFTLTSSITSGELIDKNGWIEKVLRKLDCKDLYISKMRTRIYDRTAVLNIWLHQEVTVDGKDWDSDFLLTDIWIEKDRGWQAVLRHSTWLKQKNNIYQ